MKKEISWNNKRRSASYWLAIEFLLCEALNMVWWIGSDDTVTAGLRNLIKAIYGWLIPNDPYHLFSLMLGWLTVHSFAIGAIALMNGRLSSLRDKKKDERLFQFTSKSVFMGDVILGIFLEVTALNGLITMTDTFHLTSFPFLLFLGFVIFDRFLVNYLSNYLIFLFCLRLFHILKLFDIMNLRFLQCTYYLFLYIC